jgi:hypothetical protein
MSLLARVLRSSELTHDRPTYSSLQSPVDMVPMVPNLVSSLRVLSKRALILINQIFLSW